jgi:TIR domain
MTMPDIFISYASADRDRARLLADRLTNRGYSVWWDRTIAPGRVLDEVIQEAIQSARCMIVLWSAASVRSNWVKTEAAEGVARGLLVPVLIGEVAPPIEFKRIQSANLTQWNGDEAHPEYRNLLASVEGLMTQAARDAGTDSGAKSMGATSSVKPHQVSSSATSRFGAVKTFGLGAIFALAVVGAVWLYGKVSKEREVPPPASVTAPVPPAASAPAPSATKDATPAAASPAQAASRDRVNLLSAEQGGKLLIASNERWGTLIDGKEDTYAWTDEGFGVFGFRDGRPALIDTFTLLVPNQMGTNLKDFELFAGNAAPTGPFESIGKFSTQNMRMMQNPYQEFRFAPVKAKYFKLQSLRSHDNSTAATVHEIQLFGVVQ